MESDRSSLLLLLAMLLLGVVAVSPSASPPKGTSKKAVEKARAVVDAAGEGPHATIAGALRQFWDLPDKTDWPALAKRFGTSDSTVLVATVADPMDSRMGGSFDQSIEAFVLAASAAGYTLDRFTLPWTTSPPSSGGGEAGAGAAAAAKRPSPPAHRTTPGVLLFRDSRRPDQALVVLLVGETATSGVPGDALRAALNGAHALAPGKPIAIVGPSYSGSAPTVAQAIDRWRAAGNHESIRLFSAGATSEDLAAILHRGRCPGTAPDSTCFQALVWSRAATQGALDKFVGEHGGLGRRTALFVEAGTLYGAGSPGGQTIRIPYSLHIGQARSARAEAGLLADGDKTLNSRARASLDLSFAGGHEGRDVPPVFAPAESAIAADLQLSTVLASLRRQRVAFVGILGSDARDKLFLARQIKRELPDAQLYTLLADITYLHPRWLRDLNGMWVASSYPLATDSQGGTARLAFAAHGQEAAYNALLAALAETTGNPRIAQHLIDYHWAADGQDTGPYLWISAVGNGEFWPLERVDPTREMELRFPQIGPPLPFLWTPSAPLVAAALALRNEKDGENPNLRGDEGASLRGLIRQPLGVLWALLAGVSLLLLLASERWLMWGYASQLRQLMRPAPPRACGVLWIVGWFAALLAPFAYGMSIALAVRPSPVPWWSSVGAALSWAPAANAAEPVARGDWAAVATLRRVVEFASGVSPLLPMLWLAGCGLVLLYGAARRQRLLRVARAAATVTDAAPLGSPGRRLRAALGDPTLQPSADFVGPWVAAVAPALAFGCVALPADVGIEPTWWLRAVALASTLLVYGIAVMGCSFFVIWQRLRALLRRVAQTPLLHAFARLPDHAAESLGFRLSRGLAQVGELRDAVDRLLLLQTRGELGFSPGAAGYVKARFDGELTASAELATPRPLWESETQELLASAAAAMLPWLETSWTADLASKKATGAPAAGVEGAARGEAVSDGLSQHRLGTRARIPALPLAEEFVAGEIVRYLGYVFLHLRILITCATAAALLLFFALMSYPFHPQQTLLRFVIGVMLALCAAFATVLVQSERNTLLSVLANRHPNRIDFDVRFAQQAVTFIGVPLLTLLVTQFPALEDLVQRLRGF